MTTRYRLLDHLQPPMRAHTMRKNHLLALGTAITILGVAACETHITTNYPPVREVFGFVCDVERPTDPVVARLTGGVSFENEAHDCQRLVQEAGTEFGPLVGLFPIDAAMEPQWAGRGNVASIANFTPGIAHPELNFPEDEFLSCVWLDSLSVTGRSTAKIYQPSSPSLGCGNEDAPGGHWQVLDVQISSYHDPEQIPRTARWLVSADTIQYIGSRCGPFWCSVVPVGVSPNEPRQWDRDAVATAVMPGYRDEQFLPRLDSSGEIRPGPRARIEPSQDLGDIQPSVQDYFVATVTFFDDPSGVVPDFSSKFNLEQSGPVWTSRITLDLAGNQPVAAEFVSSTRMEAGNDPAYQPENHGAGGAVRWRAPFVQVSEPNWFAGVFGAVTEFDLVMAGWVFCPFGCCSIFANSGN